MCKCGKTKCNCDSTSKDLAQLDNKVSELQEQLDTLLDAAKFLTCGHPILMIENAEDIEAFDTETGEGEECWKGWALCIGNQHKTSKGKKITTPNLLDRFIVAAGSSYDVGDTGGANTVTLTTAQIPSHTHAVTDSGHNHGVNDPGHTHGVNDPGHNHDQDPHDHDYKDATFFIPSPGGFDAENGTSGNNLLGTPDNDRTTAPATATNQEAETGISIQSANTDVTLDDAQTGITLANTGGGEAHENRPPYYALVFVMKIG